MLYKLTIFIVTIALALSACQPQILPAARPSTSPTLASQILPPTEVVVSPTPLTSQAEAAPIYKDSSATITARVEDLLSRMTLEEKIGQMTQIEKNSLRAGDVSKYMLGSVLSGGGGTPKINDAAHWAEMVQQFQSEALATRLGIPLLYGVDAVHGHNNL